MVIFSYCCLQGILSMISDFLYFLISNLFHMFLELLFYILSYSIYHLPISFFIHRKVYFVETYFF